jgi:hypothetical protein
MNKKEFIQLLKEKTVVALLDLLNLGQSGKQKIDPDFLGAIIDELNSRELSEAEAKEFENILNFAVDYSVYETEPEKVKGKFSKDEITEITVKDDNREPGRYTALKSVVGLISLLGYIVIIFGIIALIYLASNGQVPFGIAALVVSVIIALPLLAYSNLIYVFIDIEYNTRKTKEAIKKVSK